MTSPHGTQYSVSNVDDAVSARIGISCFSVFFFSNLEMAPALRVEPAGDQPLGLSV